MSQLAPRMIAGWEPVGIACRGPPPDGFGWAPWTCSNVFCCYSFFYRSLQAATKEYATELALSMDSLRLRMVARCT